MDLKFAGSALACGQAAVEASHLWATHAFPTLWGTGQIPLLPSKRSSVAVEWADVQMLKSQLPATCLFSAAVVYAGLVYVVGGRTVDFPLKSSMQLSVFDPQKDTVVQKAVAPDPKHGAPRPRTGHSAVLFGSALLVYGGDVRPFGAWRG